MKDFDKLLQVHKISLKYHGVTPRGVEEWEASLRFPHGDGNGWSLQNAIEATPRKAVEVLLDKCGRPARVRPRDRLKLWALKWVRPVAVTLLLLFPLSPWARAQERKPQPLQPVRVSLETGGEAGLAVSLDRELRAALRKLAEPAENEQRRPVDVAFVNLRADYDVTVAVARLEDVGCVGLVASMTVTGAAGNKMQSVHSGGNASKLAAHLALRLDQRYFQLRRK